jgi:hypothetical protein
MNNEKQSLEFVLEMRKRFNQPKFFIEFTEIFDNFYDSDDTDLNNLFLFAEEAFNDKQQIWFVLSVLIANFGKMIIFHLLDKYSPTTSKKNEGRGGGSRSNGRWRRSRIRSWSWSKPDAYIRGSASSES